MHVHFVRKLEVMVELEGSTRLPVVAEPFQLNDQHRRKGFDACALDGRPLRGKRTLEQLLQRST